MPSSALVDRRTLTLLRTPDKNRRARATCQAFPGRLPALQIESHGIGPLTKRPAGLRQRPRSDYRTLLRIVGVGLASSQERVQLLAHGGSLLGLELHKINIEEGQAGRTYCPRW